MTITHLSLPLTWHAPALYAPNSPLRRSSRPPDAVARSLYVFRAPAATGVQLELALLPARGWAIYTCCQAIKRLAVIRRSGGGSRHFEFAEQGTWTYAYLLPEQFLSNLVTFTAFFFFFQLGTIYRMRVASLIGIDLLFDMSEPEWGCGIFLELKPKQHNFIYFTFCVKEYVTFPRQPLLYTSLRHVC